MRKSYLLITLKMRGLSNSGEINMVMIDRQSNITVDQNHKDFDTNRNGYLYLPSL